MQSSFFYILAIIMMASEVAEGFQYPTERITLTSGMKSFLQDVGLVPIEETALSVKGSVVKDSQEIVYVRIPIPKSVKDSGIPFSSRTTDIFPYGDGTKAPCDGKNENTGKKDITFIPVIMESYTHKNTSKSFSTLQSSFSCKLEESFVECSRLFISAYLTDNYNFAAAIAVIPSCEAAKKFTDQVREGNSDTVGVWIGIGIGIPIFFILCGYCLHVYDKNDGKFDWKDWFQPQNWFKKQPEEGKPKVMKSAFYVDASDLLF